jgi:hypothetical protein
MAKNAKPAGADNTERALEDCAESTPPPNNSTLLNYEALKALGIELRRPLETLIVQSNHTDPFIADRPGARLDGARWFAALWERLEIPNGVHVRRLHYLLCSTAVLPPDGRPYLNTYKDWKFLGAASSDARYLDLVPANAFVDRRASEPIVYIPDDEPSDASALVYCSTPIISGQEEAPSFYYGPGSYDFPTLPYVAVEGPKTPEPFAIEAWAEKSTMNDVLLPLAQNQGVTLVTGVGDLSITACEAVVARTRQHGRRTRILYISDFDPNGEKMPIAVGRKIDFFRRRSGGENLDIRLVPLVLTAEQIAHYALPKSPIKESNPGREQFEERHGEGAVELDALEALHPGALGRIVEEAIRRYRAPARRLRNAVRRKEDELREEMEERATNIEEAHSAEIEGLRERWEAVQSESEQYQDQITEIIDQAKTEIEEHREAIHDLVDEFKRIADPLWSRMAWGLRAEIPDEIEWPELDLSGCDPDGLYDSRRDYVAQVDIFRRHVGKATAGKSNLTK